ncbi:MAG TPA: GPW/gp25 family protein [Polyangiaceae bacterium]|nr:GPW/gp25 family protein [Polyangiaceae bacterium]
MSADFIGKGWAFPPRISARGGIAWSEGPPRIQDAIWIICNTSLGERVMRPNFGGSARDFVFSPNSELHRTSLEDAIRQALLRWEPRIELDGVSVDPDPNEDSAVVVKIDYRLRETNELFNMVFPLYVQEGIG